METTKQKISAPLPPDNVCITIAVKNGVFEVQSSEPELSKNVEFFAWLALILKEKQDAETLYIENLAKAKTECVGLKSLHQSLATKYRNTLWSILEFVSFNDH